MASSWRKISYRIIQEVITEFLGEHQLTPPVVLTPEQLKTLKRRISKAYPFVDRKYHPYKVWLSEVKANLQALQGLPITAQGHRQIKGKRLPIHVSPGQLSLFDPSSPYFTTSNDED